MAYRDTEAGRQTRAKIKAGEGFLYLAEIEGTDTIKIGFSLDPKRRMRTLRAPRGGRAKLLASLPCTLAEEKRLHRELTGHGLYVRIGEFYPRSILTHAAIPAELRSAA